MVVCYDMARELPRTLETIAYQRGVNLSEVEVVIVDNGSPVPVGSEALAQFPCAQLLRLDPAPPSPVAAANAGVAAARGDFIGMFIDGARMLSPGLVAAALRAEALSPTPVIASLAFHLGADLQMSAAARGYDQTAEDDLLGTVDWRTDGYELFSVSVFAASSARGWFGPMGECNSLFMHRSHWNRTGGFDTRFDIAGGGLANHDLYHRAVMAPGAELFVLLGEATFHQYHGGSSTSGSGGTTPKAHFEALHGHPYEPPQRAATLVGHVPPQALPHLQRSVEWFSNQTS